MGTGSPPARHLDPHRRRRRGRNAVRAAPRTLDLAALGVLGAILALEVRVFDLERPPRVPTPTTKERHLSGPLLGNLSRRTVGVQSPFGGIDDLRLWAPDPGSMSARSSSWTSRRKVGTDTPSISAALFTGLGCWLARFKTSMIRRRVPTGSRRASIVISATCPLTPLISRQPIPRRLNARSKYSHESA